MASTTPLVHTNTSDQTSELLENFLLCNIQGLYPMKNHSKVPYIAELASESDYTFIALTESHLTPDIKDEEVKIVNYTLFRTDRKNRSHGGVVLYIRDDIAPSVEILLSHSDGMNELLIVKIKKRQQIVAVLYRPPKSEKRRFADTLEKVKEKLREVSAEPINILLLGDFNLPIIKWPSGKIVGGTNDDQDQAKLLLDLVEDTFLEQIISEPTRKHNTLDLIFMNNVDLIYSQSILKTIISDHSFVEVKTNTTKEMSVGSKLNNNVEGGLESLNFFNKNANWENVNAELNEVDWDMLENERSTEEFLEKFMIVCDSVCKNYIPKKRTVKQQVIPRYRKILMRIGQN